MTPETRRWIEADKVHAWHPFTPQDAWTAADHEPVVIVRGEGAWLFDSEGNRYLDGNSSIWTNIHGHNHPAINEAIRQQLDRIAHSSYLGFANPRASELAERLSQLAGLPRVFFSDNGSTALEVALKLALQFRLQTGQPERTRLVAFENAYHGDTLGAASLGGVPRFFERFRRFGLPVDFLPSADALDRIDPARTAALVLEPLVQGVNEMRPWPPGMLRQVRAWCDRHGVHLILDEVMTGFGRTGKMFAHQHEDTRPDFLCLAKGLTGGYLPLAATLTTSAIYDAFLGTPENAFYYGHSYTANPLGCAAALASLDLFESERTLENLAPKIVHLSSALDRLKSRRPEIREIRQTGFVAGIELAPGLGGKTCLAARRYGLLTRPIRDTLVLMPPVCTTTDQIDFAIEAIDHALSNMEREL